MTIRKKKLHDIDVDNLINEMKRQPVRIRYDGEIQTEMEYQLDMAEAKLELLEAEIAKKYRRKYNRAGEKLTEQNLKELVMTHTSVVEARNQFIEAKRNLSLAKIKFKSTINRGDMIENIGHMVRKEKEENKRNRMRK